MSRPKLNYLLEGVIALAFTASTLSGIVSLFAGSGGYQRGRNPTFQTEILGIGRSVWSDLHAWVSLVMIAGVLMHLVLHRDWIVCMTRRMIKGTSRQASSREQEVCTTAS